MKMTCPGVTILSLAPFGGAKCPPPSGPPIEVDRGSLDNVLNQCNCRLQLSLPEHLCALPAIEIRISRMKDFHPDGLIQAVPLLAQLIEARTYLQTASRDGTSPAAITEHLARWPDLPPIQVKKDPSTRNQAGRSQGQLDQILDMVSMPGQEQTDPPVHGSAVGQVDAIIVQVLGRIFSMPEFRRTEAAWRGLQFLLDQGSDSRSVKVRIVPIDHPSLAETLERLTADLIADLPAVVVVDLAFAHSAVHMAHLSHVARLAETLMVPAIAHVSSRFFQIESWQDIATLPYLPHHLETAAYGQWQTLKAASVSAWLSLVCNPMLTRFTYGPDNPPRRTGFTESEPLWISPVWAMAALIGQSVMRTGWPTRLTDHRLCRLEDLALSGSPPQPVKVRFSADRVDQLAQSGICPLTGLKGKDVAFFEKAVTVNGQPLAEQLLTSRLVQWILACKDQLPADLGAEQLQSELTQALQLFSDAWGPDGLADISVAAEQPDETGDIRLSVSITPSKAVLPTGQPVQMQFTW